MASLEEYRRILPPYLSDPSKAELKEQLEKFPNISPFYWSSTDDQPLQGDGWKGLVAINFDTLEKKTVRGLILSNSCSISPENDRALPVNIIFAPIFRLERYQQRLRSAGRTEEQIEDLTASIRRQEPNSLFYLPPRDAMPECIVFFHDLHGHPLSNFLSLERERLFALSNAGFYTLLLKLSIYFMRMQEGLDRR